MGTLMGTPAWSGVAEGYAASFASLCEGTLDRLLADLPGHRLLDVGCGTGAMAVRAQDRGREVTAVDADPDMVALARRAGVNAVSVGALPELPFPDGEFDAVTANFVVNHLSDPRAGIAELARVVAGHGRLGMTVWPTDGVGWVPLVRDAFSDVGLEIPQSSRLPAEKDFERSVEGLAAVTREIGLHVIDERELQWTWSVTPDVLWSGIRGGVATAGQAYAAAPAEQRAAADDAFARLAAQQADADGQLRLPCTAVYVLAVHES